jgi:hypothetical protein
MGRFQALFNSGLLVGEQVSTACLDVSIIISLAAPTVIG